MRPAETSEANYKDMMRHLICIYALVAALLCLPAQARQLTLSGLDTARFITTVDGKPTALYVLTNSQGAEACVTNYGARLVSLMEPNWNGRMEDVVLGYDNIADYVSRGQNFGATVGRYIGRIKGPAFTLDGVTYHLQDSGKGSISHGGKPGFANRVWSVMSHDAQSITLQYVSPDGENGFPGELTVTLTYALREDNALCIDFRATTTRPTVLNLSNHSFFNISGNPEHDILGESLWVDSRKIARYDARKNVDGTLMKVAGTPFDFRKLRPIGARIDEPDSQLKVTGGYDHCFVLRHAGNINKPAVMLFDAVSGRMLTVYTTEPAVQVYTANGLKGTETGKGGIRYARRTAVCLETMHLPDSPNHPDFPSTVLRPGQTFHSATVFRFTTVPPLLNKRH